MDPLIWGPSAWSFIHFLTIAYPDKPTREDIENHKNFINLLPKILPCSICKNHIEKNLEDIDFELILSSKNSYMNFMWDLHNKVNSLNKRPNISFNDFLSLYKNIIENGSFNPFILYKKSKIYYYSLLIIFIILSLLILYHIIFFKKV